MTEPDARTGPVFVVGAMRSGTTLLRLMLNESPDISIPAESHFVARLVKTYEPGHVLTDEERRSAVQFVTSRIEWKRDFTTSDDELVAAVGRGPLTVADFVDRIFRAETAASGKPRWGDKTPAYLFFADRIMRHFGDAQLVIVVRDPRDVYLSLRRYNWAGRTTWSIGSYLRRCGRQVQRCTTTIDTARCRVVRYEDLVLDTETTLRRLCSDLDLTFDERMLSFFERADENVQSWELEIGAHTKLLRPVQPGDVGRWRTEGQADEIAEIESMTSFVLREHGYEPSVAAWKQPLLQLRARARHARSKRQHAAKASASASSEGQP